MLKRIVSTNHRTTKSKVTAEFSIYLEDPQKQSYWSFGNSTSTVELQCITADFENNAKRRK
jgi:Cu2+-containing amine oxidase